MQWLRRKDVERVKCGCSPVFRRVCAGVCHCSAVQPAQACRFGFMASGGASGGLLYAAVCCAANARAALFAGLVCVCFAPFYLYAPIFYTDTLALPMVSLALLLAANAHHALGRRGRMLWGTLCGAAVFWGILPRAGGNFGGCHSVVRFVKKRKTGVVVCSWPFGLLLAGWQLVLRSSVLIDYEGAAIHQFPPQHFIMMGLKGKGGFDPEDEQYSLSFADRASRVQGNEAETQRRLKEFGFAVHVKHWQNKIAYTWGDGCYFAPQKLELAPLDQTPLQEWFLPGGRFHTFYSGMANGAQLLLLLFMTGFSVWFAAAERPVDMRLLELLALFGMALFFCWFGRPAPAILFAFRRCWGCCWPWGTRRCTNGLKCCCGAKERRILPPWAIDCTARQGMNQIRNRAGAPFYG